MSKSANKNASDLFIEALENEGVEVIYAVPGEENLAFLEALRKSKIELIVTRHEQAAGFMAATYGRLTGKTGVCLTTLGPGATNLVTAAAYANLGAFPMLMITGQKPIKHSKQGQFQIIDVVDMMQPITKYTRQLVDVNMIAAQVREAFREAEEERPGAVHLELPEDIAEDPVPEGAYTHFKRSHTCVPHTADDLIEQAAKIIKDAKYPLLLFGAAANRKSCRAILEKFVNETGIYFFNTQMGKGVVDETSEQFLGTAALSENDYIHCAIGRADVVINVGHDVVEKPPFFMTDDENKKVIHINYNFAIVDNVYFPQLELVGDIANSMARLGEQIGKLEKDFSYFEKVKKHLDEQIKEHDTDEGFPIKPQRLVADVRKVMPNDGVIALDNGIYKLWFARNYFAKEPNTILLDNALASMGAGLPSAMEAARLYPKRRVMAICGDGGFMMNSQEIETAVRLKLNLVVLILRDDAYGMIRWKQSMMDLPDYGLQFGNPDFVLYAQAYGATGHRLEKTNDLVPMLNQAFEAGGVHIVDCPIDYGENKKVLIDELKQKVCL